MNSKYICNVKSIDKAAVRKARAAMPDAAAMRKTARIFSCLGDGSRMRMLHALSLRELCVCDIANLLSMSVSSISHHLRILRDADLVKFRKEGKIVYYSLADRHIANLIESGVQHASE